MINWIKKHRTEGIILFVISIVALCIRLYKIDEYLTYLGDEGRDVRIVRDLITKGDLPFIGPQTSVGNMYLGPLYYYLMAPFLFLSGLNPVGPAIMNALLGVIAVLLTWYVSRDWFGSKSALITASLYALSPIAIIYSRSSWNPNPMPIFALLSIYGIYQVWQNKKDNWLLVIGFTFAAALQMHYLGLLLGPTLFIFWILRLRVLKTGTCELKLFWKKTLSMIAVFLLMMSPLFLFDFKHQGVNFSAMTKLVFGQSASINTNNFVTRLNEVVSLTIDDLVLSRQMNVSPYIVAGILFIFILIIYRNFKKPGTKLLLTWLCIGLLGLGVYKNEVYIHYLGFIYPAIFMITGLAVTNIDKLFKFKWLSYLILFALLYLSFRNSPLQQSPNNLLHRTETVVDLIIKESRGEPFNFALIAKQNYDESYRYFLENKKANMLRGEDKITNQLFVVCEDRDQCRPEGNSGYQIAIFGIAKVVEQWEVDYIKIYKMIHY